MIDANAVLKSICEKYSAAVSANDSTAYRKLYRLGEPEPKLSSLSQREQRAILREKMGLPPM